MFYTISRLHMNTKFCTLPKKALTSMGGGMLYWLYHCHTISNVQGSGKYTVIKMEKNFMEKSTVIVKKKLIIAICVILSVGLLVSIFFNIYQAFFSFDSYLQSTDEIYIMEAGILRRNLEFADGEDYKLTYDFSHDNYAVLKSKYNIESVAQEGNEFLRALRLMNEYAPRLTHKSNYDNHVPMNAIDLLEYSLDNKKQGINCRTKAQILNEMCLSLGIYARKVWIMPYSGYDNDCHVVNEVWDTMYNKWIMLDITNNEYWVDERGYPLSVMEIRSKAALQEFCTPVCYGDSIDNVQKLKQKHIGDFLYIVKNMVYMEYCGEYGVGESTDYYFLIPKPLSTKQKQISKAAVEASPLV